MLLMFVFLDGKAELHISHDPLTAPQHAEYIHESTTNHQMFLLMGPCLEKNIYGADHLSLFAVNDFACFFSFCPYS